MTCKDNEVKEYLHDNPFPVTFSSKIYYRKDDLIRSLKPIYKLYHYNNIRALPILLIRFTSSIIR